MNELISQLQRFIRLWLRIAKNRLKLFKLEFKIAKSTIKPLLLLVVLLLMNLFTLWALFLILIGLGFFALTASVFLSVALVFLINIVLLMAMLQAIRFLMNIGSFQKTRKYLKNQDIKGSSS